MFTYDVSHSDLHREIYEQPELMKVCIEKNEENVKEIAKLVRERRISKVVLVGRGSSEHALIVGKYAFEVYTDAVASMCSPSVITRMNGKMNLGDCLVIGISQCGMAQDAYTVLEKCKNDGGIAVSITNERECLMRNAGTHYLNMEVEKEYSFTAGKSYMASTILVLLLVAYIAENESLLKSVHDMPSMIQKTLDSGMEENIAKAVTLFRNANDITILARGFSFAVAHETELKIMEASYTIAKTYSSCDYPHGPIATTRRFTPVIFYLTDKTTDESTLSLIQKLQNDFSISTLVVTNKEEYVSYGNEAILLPKEAEGIDAVCPLAVFSQLFCCILAFARGYNPDAPVGLSKVTVTL
ncbi:MAG: SIS domain-containing protein [Erysipelotrichaceae bacterium]|nr:SIS domain-containing protein [Erysipelotrichaceae bacterium]